MWTRSFGKFRPSEVNFSRVFYGVRRSRIAGPAYPKDGNGMKELHKDTFDKAVLESDGVVVVDFWSDGCEECVEMMPDFENLASKYEDKAEFAKVNIQGNRRLAIREKVMGLPSILIYRNGTKEASFSKEFEIDEVESKLEEILGA